MSKLYRMIYHRLKAALHCLRGKPTMFNVKYMYPIKLISDETMMACDCIFTHDGINSAVTMLTEAELKSMIYKNIEIKLNGCSAVQAGDDDLNFNAFS